MITFLTPRRWQKHLEKGVLRRNSTAVKPAVWLFQMMKIRELRDLERARPHFKRFSLTAFPR